MKFFFSAIIFVISFMVVYMSRIRTELSQNEKDNIILTAFAVAVVVTVSYLITHTWFEHRRKRNNT